jgi:hypothetical protein
VTRRCRATVGEGEVETVANDESLMTRQILQIDEAAEAAAEYPGGGGMLICWYIDFGSLSPRPPHICRRRRLVSCAPTP